MTPAQRADIESALDSMAEALAAHGLLHEPLRSRYVRAVRIVRDLPPGIRRQRSDFSGMKPEPQLQMKGVV